MKKKTETQKVFVLLSVLFLLNISFQLNAVYIKKSDIRKSEKEMLQLINLERSSRGIDPVKYNNGLFKTAELHNREMIKMSKLSHNFINYKRLNERMKDADVFFSNAGENIAYSTAYVSEYIHNGFMKSEPHKENILDNKFTHCGISIIETKKGFYITQEFAHILPPADTGSLENNLNVFISNFCKNRNSTVPMLQGKYRKRLLTIADMVLNGKKFKNIPKNLKGFNMLTIATSSIYEILNFLRVSITGKKITKYSIAVIFGRSQKFIGGAYSVTFIFSSTERESDEKGDDSNHPL